MATEWWQTFFDQAYADTWAAAGMFDHTEVEVQTILDRLHPTGPLRILDVPCGFGRHSAALHALGHDVTGVDASADQLALAAERNPGPTYVNGDMRQPPPGPYDVVLNLFSSFGYFADPAEDLVALRAWHDALVPGGALLMELMHRDRVARLVEDGVERPVGDSGAVEIHDVDWVAGVNTATIIHPDGAQRVFRIRLYTATELVAMVHRVGFVDVTASGGLAGGPVSPEERLVVMGRRPS